MAGLIVGALTLGGQALPGFLTRNIADNAVTQAIGHFVAQHLSNSAAAWSLAAFLIVAFTPLVRGWAATAGFLTLIGATAGYYAAATVFLNDDLSAAALRSPLIWAVIAAAAGPIFGLAAAVWRRGSPQHRPWALAAIAALFLAEAIYNAAILHYWSDAATSAVMGILVVLLLATDSPQRRATLLRLIPATVVMSAALAAAFALAQLGFTL